MWGCSTFFPFHGGGFSFGGGLVWIAVIVVVILAVRAMTTSRPPSDQHRSNARADRDDAMRILRIRLAEGAITEEEFERLRRTVES